MKNIKDVDQNSQGDMVPDLREFARSTIENRIRAHPKSTPGAGFMAYAITNKFADRIP